MQRAVAISEKALGPDHPDLAAPLKNLATVYHLESRYAAAEPLYRRALGLLGKNAGESAEAAEVMGELADLYRAQRRNTEAELLYERLIPVQERLLGREHREVGGSLYLLAELYRQDGLYDKAEPLYRRSLAILEKEPAEGAALARSLKTFAAMLRHMKRKPEAAALEARAKAILNGQAPG